MTRWSVHDPELALRFNGHKAAIVVDTDSQLITAVDVLPGNAPDNLGALELVGQRSTGGSGKPVGGQSAGPARLDFHLDPNARESGRIVAVCGVCPLRPQPVKEERRLRRVSSATGGSGAQIGPAGASTSVGSRIGTLVASGKSGAQQATASSLSPAG